MRRTPSLQTTALIAALASIYPLQVFANAGVTQFSIGDVSVQRSAASTPLANGSRIDSGDLITTGSSGRTQLRFTDGGMVSLQPNSQFKITSYSDASAGKQDSFLVDLARGGMRALTGLIGKRNRDNYKVTTTTATIGIRGSGFSMAYNPDGTLGVTTEQDAIEVCTQAGCIGLNLGESALVTSANALPTRTNQRAHWNPPNPRRLITARNDDTDNEGRNKYIVNTGLAFTGAGIGESGGDPRVFLNGAAVRDANGNIVGYLGRNNDRAQGGTATEFENGTTGTQAGGDLMILGSWENVSWGGTSPGTLSQSGFVLGQPTPESAFSTAVDRRARYDLTIGTPVYSSNGVSGMLLSSSNVIVDFRSAFGAMDINLDVRMPSGFEILDGQSLPPPLAQDYNLRGSATATSAGFSSVLGVTAVGRGYENPIVEIAGPANTAGTGSVTGFFGGPQAGTIGLSYNATIGSNGYNSSIAGAGIFTRGSGSSTIAQETVALPASGPFSSQLHALDGSDFFSVDAGEGNSVFFPSSSCCSSSSTGSVVFSGTQLRSWESGSIGFNEGNISASPAPSGASVLQYGAFGQPTDSHFLGWGAWQTGVTEKLNVNSGYSQNLTAVHYVIGKPSYNSDGWTGSATYSFIGGTNPTATNSSGTAVGNISSASNLAINFGSSPTVTANIFLSFNGTPVTINQTGTLGGNSGSSGNIYSTGNSADGQFSGILSGSQAERAGIVYGINHSTLGAVRGAAAFQTATPPSRNNLN